MTQVSMIQNCNVLSTSRQETYQENSVGIKSCDFTLCAWPTKCIFITLLRIICHIYFKTVKKDYKRKSRNEMLTRIFIMMLFVFNTCYKWNTFFVNCNWVFLNVSGRTYHVTLLINSFKRSKDKGCCSGCLINKIL